MRGKRSKQYRKLMQQYALNFGFREPYQVVVDAQMLIDSHRFSMDLPAMLSRTLHGEVKPMITQCSIRHLYALPTSTATAQSDSAPQLHPSDSQPLAAPVSSANKTALLDLSRGLTLRRCNHHTLPAPLSPLVCLSSVIDPGQNGTNKHRLVLAAQDEAVRRWARAEVRGVPSIYVKRSVMVMEPMSEASARVKEGVERGKIKGEVKVKRRQGNDDEAGQSDEGGGLQVDERQRKNAGKARGPKEPNPLSVKRKKDVRKAVDAEADEGGRPARAGKNPEMTKDPAEGEPKRKRRRKHGKGGEEGGEVAVAETSVAEIVA